MKKKHIIAIVGSRNTGKTTTIVYLADIFSEIGLKIAIIKFMHHKFDLDPNNKDSAILRESKASMIISASPHETVVYYSTLKREKLDKLLQYIPNDTDIIFCESYPPNYPQIPIIFVCKNTEDYIETKKRYHNQSPLFITGDIASNELNTYDNIQIIPNTSSESLKKGIKLMLNSS